MQTHGTHLISLLAGRLVRHARHIASTHPQRAQRCRGARIRCARRGSAHEPCQSQHNQDVPSVAAAIACDPAPSGAAPAASRATRNTRRDGGPRCRETAPCALRHAGARSRGVGGEVGSTPVGNALKAAAVPAEVASAIAASATRTKRSMLHPSPLSWKIVTRYCLSFFAAPAENKATVGGRQNHVKPSGLATRSAISNLPRRARCRARIPRTARWQSPATGSSMRG